MARIFRACILLSLLAGCIKQYVPDLTLQSIEGTLSPGVPPGWVFTGTGLDDMSDRKIEASLDWRRYQIVLDIPADADYICYGITLHGTGQVWIDDCTLEMVDDSVETTGTWRPSSEHQSSRDPFFLDEPFNMDFEIIEQ